ncbi:MAG: hypothetical protein EOM50_07035 [Erysipelotrichia bacterium]|nr:hypothetical protein [Erysipelotrichia bacterium]
MKNDRITGKIELTKTGEKLTGTKTDNKGNIDFVYEQKGLANTTYTLYANEDIISSINGKVLFKKNEKVQEKTSDEQGKIVFDKLELGSYYLQETQAETGYVLDDSKIDVVLTKKDNHTKLIVEDVKASNTRQKVDLSVFKKDSMTDKGLQGVKLATYLKEDLYSYDNTLLLEKGTKIETRTSDEKGYVNFKADYPFIKLEVKELETIEGYYLSDKVLDVNVKYQGQEKAIAKIEKEFANDIIQSKGNLIWNKTGYVFMDTEEIESEYGPITKPVYEKQNILGAEIEVYTAEDIVLRNGVKVLDKDTKVDTLESDFELTKSKDLHSGKYYYIESKVPTNYVGNSEKHYFTIEDSKTTDLTQTSETLYNPSPTIKVNFTKTLEQDSNTTGNEYKQVRYGLYTRDDTYNYMGEVKLPYNTLVDVLKIDENGNFINFPKHLPVGNYYVKELQTDNAYKIDLNEYDFEVTQTNDETYEIEINKNEPVKNVLKDYTLQLQKVDSETKQAIVNNGFEFTRYADKDCTEEIATGTLNLEKGTIMFNSVHYGVTYLKETQAPTGYEISDKVIKVEINDEGVFIDDEKIENEDDVYSFVVENKKIPETKEVETGDTSNPTLYLGLMGMSCIALSGVLMCRNKKKERGK